MRSVAAQTVKLRQSKQRRFVAKWRFGLIQAWSAAYSLGGKGNPCGRSSATPPAGRSYLIYQLMRCRTPEVGGPTNRLTERQRQVGQTRYPRNRRLVGRYSLT